LRFELVMVKLNRNSVSITNLQKYFTQVSGLY